MHKRSNYFIANKRGNTATLLLMTQGLFSCGGGSSHSISGELQTLFGTAGDDLLESSTNYGRIEGLAGDDKIYGSEHGEIIVPGFGSDKVFASGGSDTINVVSFSDEIDGGSGSDTLSLNFANIDTEVYISLAEGLMYNTRAAAIDRSIFFNIENVEIISNNSITFFGNDEDSQIITAAGNDTLHLGSGNNIANSGAGSDHVYIAGSNSTVNLGLGDDLVTTSSLDSTIDGANGNDKFILSPDSFETPLTIDFGLQTFTSASRSGSLNIVNIEQYEFSETNSITIHGSDAAESFTLFNGSGTIYGSGGGDTFTGSSEPDTYIFSQKYESSDTITNFSTSDSGSDLIIFDQANFGLSGSAHQEISLFSGGRKVITADVGFIFIKDQIGFSSESALSVALSGTNGVTTTGSPLGSIICMWWEANSSSALISLVTDFSPNNNSLDQIETVVILENLTIGDYLSFSDSNIEFI